MLRKLSRPVFQRHPYSYLVDFNTFNTNIEVKTYCILCESILIANRTPRGIKFKDFFKKYGSMLHYQRKNKNLLNSQNTKH